MQECFSGWFSPCSGHGNCINGSCICDPGWSGNGPFFDVGSNDCSNYLPAIHYLNYAAIASSVVSACSNLVIMFIFRKELDIRKSTTRIFISLLVYSIIGLILYFCFAFNYYIHNNLGVWFILCIQSAVGCYYVDSLVHMTIRINYRLQHHHRGMQKLFFIVSTIKCLIIYGLALATNYYKDPHYQVWLARCTHMVYIVMALFYGLSLWYFGSAIENKLAKNDDANEKLISAIRKFRLTTSMFHIGMAVGAIIQVIIPTIANYGYCIVISNFTAVSTYLNAKRLWKQRESREREKQASGCSS